MRPRLASPTLVGLLEAGAALTALFSVVTFFDPLHRLLELLAHFRLQYLVVAALLTVILGALRRRRWFVLMLAVTLVDFWPVVSWYVPGRPAAAAPAARLKLLSVNVWSGNHDTARLLALIRAEAPDLVFLQEVTDEWAAAIGSLADSYPYRYVIPRNDNFGVALLSRRPFAGVDAIDTPPHDRPSLLAELDVDGRRVSFIGTHPMPPLGAAGFDARNRQLAAVAALAAGLDGPVILAGDLNTTMWGDHFGQLVATSGLENARRGFGILPTWPTAYPPAMIPLDHCLVSDDFAVLDMRAGARIGSDHLPIIVSLALRPDAVLHGDQIVAVHPRRRPPARATPATRR
jgi:endonuclease/exonuclease/phosphatase (EEP) superfamily protein YafD